MLRLRLIALLLCAALHFGAFYICNAIHGDYASDDWHWTRAAIVSFSRAIMFWVVAGFSDSFGLTKNLSFVLRLFLMTMFFICVADGADKLAQESSWTLWDTITVVITFIYIPKKIYDN